MTKPTPLERRFDGEFARGPEGSDQHVFEAALSSESLVQRYFGQEELIHTSDAIDLSRDKGDGFPLLSNHGGELIGRVRQVRLGQDRKLRGLVDFSPHGETAETWRRNVRDGYAVDMSVGYTVDPESMQRVKGTDVVKVARWAPHEFSMVSVGADPTAGIGRNLEGVEMPDDNIASAAQEKKRQSEIRTIFGPYMRRGPAVEALLNQVIEDDTAPGAAGIRLLEVLGGNAEPLADDFDQGPRGGFTSHADRTDIRPGADKRDKLVQAANEALEYRGNVMSDEQRAKYDPGSNPFQGYTLSELARAFANEYMPGERFESRSRMIAEVMTRATPSHGTGDFSNLLVSLGTKTLLNGFGAAGETWMQWCRTGSLPDYKQAARVGMSEYTDIPVVAEGADIPYGDAADARENIQLAKYASRLSLTREAILGDDLSAFQTLAGKMGRAAARVPGDLAYAVLTGNPTLNQDATAVFDATHANQVASSGTAPTAASVAAARTAMAVQTDYSGNQTLGIRLAHLMVPLELEDATRVLATSEFDPDATAGVFAPNSQRGRFTVISDHRLSTDSAVKWYAACSSSAGDTVEVAFLNGNVNPTTEREQIFANDALHIKVRLECGAAALDYRGLYYNVGA